jgi:hexosaminidase
MQSMRTRLVVLLLLLVSVPAAAQTDAPPRVKLGDNRAAGLKLRWQLEEDVFTGSGEGSARASFTLTNQAKDTIPATGWALYFNALHEPRAGSVGGGFRAERVTGDLLRLIPGPGFTGLRPGQSVKIEYLTSLLTNVSFGPIGPYVVFDDTPDVGRPLGEYVAAPFTRGPQGEGRDPRVITPAQQYALDAQIRDVPAAELPRVFPTAVLVEKRDGELRLQALPRVEAPADLKSEAAFAASYLAPYFDKTPAPEGAPTVRLSTGTIFGQTSREAYELDVDAQGIRIVGASPAGVFYGLQSLRGLLPAPAAAKGLVLEAVHVKDAPRFGYRGFMLDVARNFQTKEQVLRVLDLLARYKLNTFHFHLTEDEGWRLEIPSLPELVAVGSRRGHTLDSGRHMPPHWGSGAAPDRAWGSGHYTRAEYVEIVRYAAARHIEVIPELEMPGHARAAIKAMEARFRERTKAGDA